MNKLIYLLLTSSFLISACGGGGGGSHDGDNPSTDDETNNTTEQIEHLSAGDTSVNLVNANAFSEHSANLTEADKIKIFNLGNDFFENPWVAGSASTSSRDGLGGLFNNNACQDCHIRDGRGHAPNVSVTEDGTDFSSLLIRASRSQLSSSDESLIAQSLIANIPDTSVGGQLQHDAIANVTKEADLRVSYDTVTVNFSDGTSTDLRKPIWHFTSNYANQGYDFDSDTVFSARVAPPMIGLGLLALIPEATLRTNADPEDGNGDGISGKANDVWSIEQQNVTLGRFGWKAGQPSIIEQAAGAFVNDMGLTNNLHQNESCLAHQADCIASPNGNGDSVENYDYEVSDTILNAVNFYSAHLSVPQRRDAYSNSVQNGKAIFIESGCTQCHMEQYTTAASSEFPELSEQVIFPYTDLLLHDMGSDLADFTISNQAADENTPVEFLATATEWRTPPLWGIGLAKTVDPDATFLHDGRARTIMEAILWHGGEAESAKQNILQLGSSQRSELLAFLNDL